MAPKTPLRATAGGPPALAQALPAVCTHCAAPVPEARQALPADESRFCCNGCKEANAFLQDAGLNRFYDLADGGIRAANRETKRPTLWLAPHRDAIAVGDRSPRKFALFGVHCTACVWLIDQLFRRRATAADTIHIDTARGAITLRVAPPFDLDAFAEDVLRVGMELGPAKDLGARRDPDGITMRFGVAVALAMNAMLFAFAIYAGLNEGPLFVLFQRLQLVIAGLSVLIAAPVFVKGAVGALRRGVLHLDLPIALGMLLAYASACIGYVATNGGTSAAYFDTVTVFVALMLLGRLLQRRVVDQNRKGLRESASADLLYANVLESDGGPSRLKTVPAANLVIGDRILLAPGDLLPVDATLTAPELSVALDWIRGESAPVRMVEGAVVPGGAFHVGRRAVELVATEAFVDGRVADLLTSALPSDRNDARETAFDRALARYWVITVLALAVVGFGGWLLATHDLPRALAVTAAILIVTCPCAFGIATPLAYELVQAGLRKSGFFVRTAGFLDRAAAVTALVFDKTGTLTEGRPRLENTEALTRISEEDREVLGALVARSSHPKSKALRDALTAQRSGGLVWRNDLTVLETAGEGLRARCNDRRYALLGAGETTVFKKDDDTIAAFTFVEAEKAGVSRALEELRGEGYRISLLSGDHPEKVAALASRLGLPAEAARGNARPEDKAAALGALATAGERTLFLGDGLNDSLAATQAFVSGTAVVDHGMLAAKCDFYLGHQGIAAVPVALRAAKQLRRVVRRNLAMALAYNVLTVGLALAGRMSPLLCAVVMPLSSLSTIAVTVLSLRSPSERQ